MQIYEFIKKYPQHRERLEEVVGENVMQEAQELKQLHRHMAVKPYEVEIASGVDPAIDVVEMELKETPTNYIVLVTKH